MSIIRAEKVSKCYRIYRHPSDHLKELLSFGRRRYHEPFWAVHILEGNKNIQWGMSGSPLVHDQYVIVNPGVQDPSFAGQGLMAFQRFTGTLAWLLLDVVVVTCDVSVDAVGCDGSPAEGAGGFPAVCDALLPRPATASRSTT